MSRGDHVGLQQGPFQVHVMVTQSLIHSSQDLRIRGGLLRPGPCHLLLYAPCLEVGGHDCEGQYRLRLTGLF